MKRITQKTLTKLCDLLYATHYLPIACFSEDKLVHFSCAYPGMAAVFRSVAESLSEGIAETDLGLFGAVRIGNGSLSVVAGPFLNKKPDADMFAALVRSYGFSDSEREPLRQFLLSLPRYSLNRFLNFLALLAFLFNGEELDISGYFRQFAPAVQQNVAQKRADEIFAENDFSHGTYYLEQQLLSLVSAGDVYGLNKLFDAIAKATPVVEGKVADDTLRQSKNILLKKPIS